eukprot:gene17351-19084_t
MGEIGSEMPVIHHSRKKFRRCIASLVVISFCCFLYYTLNNRSWAWYVGSKKRSCALPKDEADDLISLIKDTHVVLNMFGITHVLGYGSLFGAIRYKKPLPWDNDFDLLLRDEELDTIDIKDLENNFKMKDIKMEYKNWMGGYRLTRGRSRGDLMIFKDYDGTMKRVGLESYAFFVNYQHYHNFPTRLLKIPLPTLEFCGMNFSVPRNGLEIQKYHYPDDWWQEKKPKGC